MPLPPAPILTRPETKNRKTRRRARIPAAYTAALAEARAEAQEALEKERRRQKERQRNVLKRFRELVRRKEALEGEIEKILGIVRGGCL